MSKYHIVGKLMHWLILFIKNCKPTPSLPGDGIDNDCDNKIDEELCTPENKGKGNCI